MTQVEWEKILKIAKNCPSGGNSQPWNVIVSKDTVTLTLPENFVQNSLSYEILGAYFCLGALSHNIQQVAEGYGYQTHYELSQLDQPQVIIKVTNYDAASICLDTVDIVKSRCTNRKPSIGKIPNDIIDKFLTDFHQFQQQNNFKHTMDLSLFDKKEDITTIADILAKAEYIRFKNVTSRNKLFSELKCHLQSSEDKISLKELEIPFILEKLMCLMIKYPKFQACLPASVAQQTVKKQIKDSSHLVVLHANKQLSALDLIDVGRTMQFLWLKITQYKYFLQPWTSLSFYNLESSLKMKETFSGESKDELQQLSKKLSLLSKDKESYPLFIFRLLNAPRPLHRSNKKDLI